MSSSGSVTVTFSRDLYFPRWTMEPFNANFLAIEPNVVYEENLEDDSAFEAIDFDEE